MDSKPVSNKVLLKNKWLIADFTSSVQNLNAIFILAGNIK